MSSTLRPTRDGWSVRIRMGAGQRRWLPMPAMKEDAAELRRDRLQRLAEEFVRAGKREGVERVLRDCANQPSPAAFDIAEKAARRLLTEAPDAKPIETKTFRDVCELWLSGDLHRLYPDDVRAKSKTTQDADRAALKIFLPLLGHLNIATITMAQTEEAKRAIPPTIASTTRALYLRRLRFVFKLAIEPLGLITTLPLRGNFVPLKVDLREFWFLYPEEETLLVTCVGIPLEYRLLYGFLARNGTRLGETLKLTWGSIDFERAVVRLDKSWTKTRRGRVWKLDPDVLGALSARYVALGRPPASARVFAHPDPKKKLTRQLIDKRFTEDLKRAGITRQELLESTPDARKLRVHDLRATFVTLARKIGYADRWIMDRTGHETLGVLGKYERFVRHASELDLGWFSPLDVGLFGKPGPTVAWTKGGPKVAQSSQFAEQNAMSDTSRWNDTGGSGPSDEPNLAAASRSDPLNKPFGPPLEGGVAQNSTALRLTAQQLEALLGLATTARRYDLVTALGEQLEACKQARGSNVTRLDERRRR